jgi:hypothetical protein
MATATQNKLACDHCGAPATLRDKTQGDAACEPCARFAFGFRCGQAHTAAHMIEQMMEVLTSVAASHDEVRAGLEHALIGREPQLGAAVAVAAARGRDAREGVAVDEWPSESRRWTEQFEPLDGGDA